jgi:SAM-dependent methyltransferase
MDKTPKWPEAQRVEKQFWDGVIQDESAILHMLAENAERAPHVRNCFKRTPENSLEVGVGPLGLGVSGYLPEIPHRFAMDPLPPVSLGDSQNGQGRSGKEVREYIRQMRAAIQYVVGRGEEIPVRSESVDLVICCNVIDHSYDPGAILQEIHRILKPDGIFFFDVDTFSVVGLAKWYSWTRYAHRNEILVKAHPHRMYEAGVVQRLRSCGFQTRKLSGHTLIGNLVGRALASTYLLEKER